MFELPFFTFKNRESNPPRFGFGIRDKFESKLIIALTKENRGKLEAVIKKIKKISGEKYTPANVVYLGINLVSLLVELETHGGTLVARTPDKDKELTISNSNLSFKESIISEKKHTATH